MTQVEADSPSRPRRHTLIDLGELDLTACLADRTAIEKYNPHRHELALLDRIVWISGDRTSAVAALEAREDAFWVRGHFPGHPLMPGVLMVEAGAQVACYLWNIRQPVPRVAAFLRIENCAFRRSVVPGETLYILCEEVKCGRRRFVSKVQGVVNDEIAFEAEVSGMAMEEHRA